MIYQRSERSINKAIASARAPRSDTTCLENAFASEPSLGCMSRARSPISFTRARCSLRSDTASVYAFCLSRHRAAAPQPLAYETSRSVLVEGADIPGAGWEFDSRNHVPQPPTLRPEQPSVARQHARPTPSPYSCPQAVLCFGFRNGCAKLIRCCPSNTSATS